MNGLAILAKHWTPGQVKTRLSHTCSPEQAAAVHRACLTCLCTKFQAAGQQRWLAYTPAQQQTDFAALAGSHFKLALQPSGDLGARMAWALQLGFDAGVERMILLGADSPTLPLTILEAAWAALQRVPVVLGPSDDGGYYLIGARPPVPPLFAEVTWSTPQVWPQTLALLAAAQLEYHTLPVWFDVDTPADLARLQHELSQNNEPPAHAQLAADLSQILNPELPRARSE